MESSRYRLTIWRLGLVRLATSVLVVLISGTLNRVMVADMRVSASVVSLLFAVQHFVSPVGILSGHLSDTRRLWGRRRSPHILGGFLLAVVVMPFFPWLAETLQHSPGQWQPLIGGIVLFTIFGAGVTVSATGVNSLLVDLVPPQERGGAMALVWILTLLGFMVGSLLLLDLFPIYSQQGLEDTFWVVTLLVLGLGLAGGIRVEPRQASQSISQTFGWRANLKSLHGDHSLRWFFLFLGMTNFFFFLQDFILEPYGGEALGYIVATTTSFNVYWAAGVLVGMLALTALISRYGPEKGRYSLLVSCLAGAAAFGLLAATSAWQMRWLVLNSVLILGLSKGIYNVGLSQLTMRLVHERNSGLFMGLWNLVSGLSIALGEGLGGVLRDWLASLTLPIKYAYAAIFLIEAGGMLACLMPLLMIRRGRRIPPRKLTKNEWTVGNS